MLCRPLRNTNLGTPAVVVEVEVAVVAVVAVFQMKFQSRFPRTDRLSLLGYSGRKRKGLGYYNEAQRDPR
jgi:hypothetical protein